MELRDRNQKVASELTATLMENGLAEHPEEEILPGGDPGRLDRCLQGLAEPQKNCITLFYLQEKSYREISVTTGYDFNQVKSYIQNGKRNLKNCMEQG
jgi:RNA polymerase sigma-70 factor (ECF subfamily)